MKNQMQEVPLEYYFAKYRELDPSDAARRTGLHFDAEKNRYTLYSLGFTIYASWPEFELTPDDPERCPKILLGFSMQIVTLRFLLEGVSAPALGQFKAYRELPWGELYDANFQGRCIKRLAFSYGSRLNVFEKAAEKLGGVRLSLGDASFDMPFLGNVVCRLILWGRDEEFPPSAQFLFSDNTRFAWGAEDLAGVGDIMIGALEEASASS